MYKLLNLDIFSWSNWAPNSGECDADLAVATYTKVNKCSSINLRLGQLNVKFYHRGLFVMHNESMIISYQLWGEQITHRLTPIGVETIFFFTSKFRILFPSLGALRGSCAPFPLITSFQRYIQAAIYVNFMGFLSNHSRKWLKSTFWAFIGT